MTPPPVSDIVSRLSPTGRRALLALAADPHVQVHPAALLALRSRGLVATDERDRVRRPLALHHAIVLTNLGRQVAAYLEAP